MTVEEVIAKLRGTMELASQRDLHWALTGAYNHTVERFHDSCTFVAQQSSL